MQEDSYDLANMGLPVGAEHSDFAIEAEISIGHQLQSPGFGLIQGVYLDAVKSKSHRFLDPATCRYRESWGMYRADGIVIMGYSRIRSLSGQSGQVMERTRSQQVVPCGL